jgi:hypothetical protein
MPPRCSFNLAYAIAAQIAAIGSILKTKHALSMRLSKHFCLKKPMDTACSKCHFYRLNAKKALAPPAQQAAQDAAHNLPAN